MLGGALCRFLGAFAGGAWFRHRVDVGQFEIDVVDLDHVVCRVVPHLRSGSRHGGEWYRLPKMCVLTLFLGLFGACCSAITVPAHRQRSLTQRMLPAARLWLRAGRRVLLPDAGRDRVFVAADGSGGSSRTSYAWRRCSRDNHEGTIALPFGMIVPACAIRLFVCATWFASRRCTLFCVHVYTSACCVLPPCLCIEADSLASHRGEATLAPCVPCADFFGDVVSDERWIPSRDASNRNKKSARAVPDRAAVRLFPVVAYRGMTARLDTRARDDMRACVPVSVCASPATCHRQCPRRWLFGASFWMLPRTFADAVFIIIRPSA